MYDKLITSLNKFIENNYTALVNLDSYAIFNAWTSAERTTVDFENIEHILIFIEDNMAIRKSEAIELIKEVQL